MIIYLNYQHVYMSQLPTQLYVLTTNRLICLDYQHRSSRPIYKVSLGPGNRLAWVEICPQVFGINQLFLASQTLLPWTVCRERKVRANALVQYTWEGDRMLCLIASGAIWQAWICRKLCLKSLWLWDHLSSLGRKWMAYFTWSFQNLSPAPDQDWSQRLWHAWQVFPNGICFQPLKKNLKSWL